jgi:hypothetical protein
LGSGNPKAGNSGKSGNEGEGLNQPQSRVLARFANSDHTQYLMGSAPKSPANYLSPEHPPKEG